MQSRPESYHLLSLPDTRRHAARSTTLCIPHQKKEMSAFAFAFVPCVPLTRYHQHQHRLCKRHGINANVPRSGSAARLRVMCNAGTGTSSSSDDEQPLDELAMRVAEIHEVMEGLKEFKVRIIDDATKLAKKVRAPKKQLEAALASHPDIIKIDGHIAELEEELKGLENR